MNIAIPWHAKKATNALDELASREHGLTTEEVRTRLEQYGPNTLPEAKPDGILIIFLRQFQSPLVYILFAASAIVLFMGEHADALIITFTLIFNAVVGTIQEGRAQNTLAALKKIVVTDATVVRDGKEMDIPDTEVVPGDILMLQEGERVSADARVLVENTLKADEAVLTGESTPVHKISEVIEKNNLPVAEQKNMLFKGTHIVSGNGRAVVVATGMHTVIGGIAQELGSITSDIPLKAEIAKLSRVIILAVIAITGAIFTFGIIMDHAAREMFATVVSIAVSIVPEGLPIVITLVLATGVWRMSKRNALVKKLQAVEALGQARIIAVDKTGTITKNELVVRKAYVDRTMFDIEGVGYDQRGDVRTNGQVIDSANHEPLLMIGKMATWCASARVFFSEETKLWRVTGDPTEAALLVFGEKLGFHKDELEHESPLISDIPFEYESKYHATTHREGGRLVLAVLGAPEVVLRLSEKVWHNGKHHALEKQERDELQNTFVQMSRGGLRVVAGATMDDAKENVHPSEVRGLTFLGFLGMQDALRPEVKGAVAEAEEAGIKVVMITGDHAVTAEAIARDAGIFKEGDLVLAGHEIDRMQHEELVRKISRVSVFARVTPAHKLMLIKAYKAQGYIVAMTGDGVNDASSLVAADLGIAMGRIGTEVAKEAADIVLLDDNFGSIVAAIEEGRSIYKTIKKVILYLFSTSVGEVGTIAGALLLGYPLPVLPAQIVWLNLVTDGFLDVALSMEPKEKGLLRGTFERSKRFLVDKLMGIRMVTMALPMAIGTLTLFQYFYPGDMAKALTVSLTCLAVFQWFNAWNCRSEEKSIFRMNPFANLPLVGATAVVITLQLLALYTPALQKLLHTVPLTLQEWALIVPVASSIILVEELRKFFYRRQLNKTII